MFDSIDTVPNNAVTRLKPKKPTNPQFNPPMITNTRAIKPKVFSFCILFFLMCYATFYLPPIFYLAIFLLATELSTILDIYSSLLIFLAINRLFNPA